LSKKIEILEKLGAVANELTWNVKTNGKTDLVIDAKKQGKWEVSQPHPMTNQRYQTSRQVLSENEIEIARRQSLQAKSRQVQPNLAMSSNLTDLV